MLIKSLTEINKINDETVLKPSVIVEFIVEIVMQFAIYAFS